MNCLLMKCAQGSGPATRVVEHHHHHYHAGPEAGGAVAEEGGSVATALSATIVGGVLQSASFQIGVASPSAGAEAEGDAEGDEAVDLSKTSA